MKGLRYAHLKIKGLVFVLEGQKELENCNFAKTILMLLVVLYHSMVFWRGNWFCDAPAILSPALSLAAKWLDSFHIYAFTLISGYIFYYQQRENKKHYSSYKALISSKFKRLLIPYIFVSVIWVIPISEYFFHDGVKEVLYKYALATSPSQLWFLVMLFDVFVIFYPISSMIDKGPGYALIFVGGGYLISTIGERILPNIFQIWTAFRYLIFFVIGYEIRRYGTGWLRRIPIWVWLVCDVIIFAITQIPVTHGSIFVRLTNSVLRNLANIWGAVAFFLIAQSAAEHIRWRESGVFLRLQRVSMPVYLFHQQIIYFSIRILNGQVPPVAHTLINFGAAVSVSFAISSLLLRYRTTKFLIGER